MSLPRYYSIRVTSSHPDARDLVVTASRLVATNLEWGPDEETLIEAVEHDPSRTLPVYLTGFHLAPAALGSE